MQGRWYACGAALCYHLFHASLALLTYLSHGRTIALIVAFLEQTAAILPWIVCTGCSAKLSIVLLALIIQSAVPWQAFKMAARHRCNHTLAAGVTFEHQQQHLIKASGDYMTLALGVAVQSLMCQTLCAHAGAPSGFYS